MMRWSLLSVLNITLKLRKTLIKRNENGIKSPVCNSRPVISFRLKILFFGDIANICYKTRTL